MKKKFDFAGLMQYPPYVALANVLFSGKDPAKTVDEAAEFAKFVLARKTETMKMSGSGDRGHRQNFRVPSLPDAGQEPSRKDLQTACGQPWSLRGKRKAGIRCCSIDIDPYSIV